ncbi:MAG TPA: hypothetical protein VF060_17015 [Trebonia sp.]
MRRITNRGRGDPGDPDAYWRRRFFILGGGLAVLMLLAWLFGSGGPSRQASQAAAAHASMAARQTRESLPSAAYGTPYGARPSQSASTTPFPSISDSPTNLPSPSASGAARASGAGRPCPPASIVLSLFTSQPSYQPEEQPTFDVYAVSTSASACQLRYGPAAVRVVATRQGKVVWDSAACQTTRQTARMVNLAPGVPQEVELAWNRQAAARSCAGSLPPDEWGIFQAVAQADGHSSPIRSFKLVS